MADADVTSLKARARARAMSQSERGLHVTPALADLLLTIGARHIAAFLPLPSEVDPLPVLVATADRGAEVSFARVAGQGLQFVCLDPEAVAAGTADISIGELGVRQPGSGRQVRLSDCDAIIVPALACDLGGARLGRGGGYYDRALAGIAATTPVVAVVHDAQVWQAGEVPVEPHDRPVSVIATPMRLIVLRRS